MDFRLNWKENKTGMLKIAGIAVLLLLIISVALNLIQTPISPLRQASIGGMGFSAPSSGGISEKAADTFYPESAEFSLSTRNIAPIPPYQNGATGSDAEQFEVTQYQLASKHAITHAIAR